MNNFIEAAKQLSGAYNLFFRWLLIFHSLLQNSAPFSKIFSISFYCLNVRKDLFIFYNFSSFRLSGNWALHMSLKIVRAWAWGDRIPDCSAKMHERILISRGGSSSNQFKTKSVLKSLQFDSKLCTMYKKYRLCLLALETKMLKGNQLYLQIDPITLKRKNLISWLRMDMFRGCLVCNFKQPFSVFKQHFTHFNVLFHPHVFPQMFSNNKFQFLNTCTKRTLKL